MPREILYSKLIESSTFAESEFIKSTIEDLAFGIAPKSTYITKNYLVCNVKDKEFTYKIDETKDAHQIYTELYALLKTRLQLRSSSELQQFKDVMNNQQNTPALLSQWSTIKRKFIREHLVSNFVTRMTLQYELPRPIANKLRGFLNAGIILKFINSNHIAFHDNEIVAIEGLTFEPGNVIFPRQQDDGGSNNIEYISNQISLIDLWKKYLASVEKEVFH